MKHETTGISYRVDMEVVDYLKVEQRDNEEPFLTCLHSQLEDLGCERIEYSGHFGPAIFFTLGGRNHGEQLKKIKATIKNYIIN